VHQQKGERNFHAFYQLLTGANDPTLKDLKLERSADRYHFIRQGGEPKVKYPITGLVILLFLYTANQNYNMKTRQRSDEKLSNCMPCYIVYISHPANQNMCIIINCPYMRNLKL